MPHSRRSSVGFALSPTKRRSILAPPAPPDTPKSRKQSLDDNVFLDVPENNDEKEKKERQLNRLQQQMQSRTLSSPTATPTDRRRSLNAVAGLTNQQLSEHYTKCIQLSAENKISVKNAFNLQLIDYMSEMLRRKDSEMHNFQVASCTLDASTKIYAYRVDSVHTDTLKMAGGLGRTQDREKNKEVDEHGEVGIEGDKKRRKVKKKAVVETNLRNISVTKFDLEFEVDPLFKKTAAQFDEGRSGSGQFLNSLQLQDDSCLMMLDSEIVMMDVGRGTVPAKTEKVLTHRLGDMNHLICPTFAPFEFTTWKIGDEDTFCETSRVIGGRDDHQAGDDIHRFDINAVPEPIGNDVNFDADDGFGTDGIGDDDDYPENGTVVTIGQQGCHRVPPPLMEAVHVKDLLALNPSEYSYFDNQLLSAWAGPGHWRMRPLSKAVKSMKDNKAEELKRKKKEFITLVYEEEDPEIDKLFAVTRKATKLSHTTLRTWCKEKTTLPMDLHYDGRNFTKLFGRPAIIIQRQKKAATVDDSIQEYDYDNQNDRDNYCADVDDGASGYGDNSVPGYDLTEIFSQTVVGSNPLNGEDPDNKGCDFLENLVVAPNKVAKINIGYARTAKKMDMKKLKTAIWSFLVDPTNNKENETQLENRAQAQLEQNKMDDNNTIDFSNLYKNLPPRMSSKMSENLSVPLAFIALLHLCNENSLKLCGRGDLKDFTITQG